MKNAERIFSYGKNDRKLFILLSLVYLIFEILTLIKTSYFVIIAQRELRIPFELFFLDWFIVSLYMFFVIRNTQKMLNRGKSWTTIVLIHFFLAVIVNTVSRTIIESYTYSAQERNFTELSLDYVIRRFMAYIDINYLIYIVMVSAIYLYYYSQQVQYAETQKRILQNNLLSTKLKLINSQIQPHFLFNTINCVVSLIKSNPEKATNTLVDLSEFLRDTIYLEEEKLVPLKDELKNLRKYSNIIKARFEDKLTIVQNVDFEVLNFLIPPFVLQPIFENAIKHGYKENLRKLQIHMGIRRKGNNHLQIEIYNDGSPLHHSSGTHLQGIGLSSINDRLKGLFNENFAFTIQNCKTKPGVKNTIIIPLVKDRPTEKNILPIS